MIAYIAFYLGLLFVLDKIFAKLENRLYIIIIEVLIVLIGSYLYYPHSMFCKDSFFDTEITWRHFPMYVAMNLAMFYMADSYFARHSRDINYFIFSICIAVNCYAMVYFANTSPKPAKPKIELQLSSLESKGQSLRFHTKI